MRHLCFQDSSFDLALIMFTTFGYFENKDNFMVLQEAHRVLDNGGILVLDLPNYSRISSNFSVNREMPLRSRDVIEYRKRMSSTQFSGHGVYVLLPELKGSHLEAGMDS